MAFWTAPGRSLTVDGVEINREGEAPGFAENRPLSDVFLPLFFTLRTFLSSGACLFFLSSLASVSASQGAFTFPRDAGLLLFHSAEPASPAISDMERLLSTELSYCSMS